MFTVTHDHRAFARFSARFPTKFKDGAEDYGQSVFLRDLSASGARIMAREQLFIDDLLSLEVAFPDGKSPLELNGRVRWVHNPAPRVWEAGVQFPRVDFMKVHRVMKFSPEGLPS